MSVSGSRKVRPDTRHSHTHVEMTVTETEVLGACPDAEQTLGASPDKAYRDPVRTMCYQVPNSFLGRGVDDWLFIRQA